MDHLTFAQLLGNYGEFIGAIGVVVTLGYLAIQIRFNAKATNSESTQAMASQMRELLVSDDRLYPWMDVWLHGEREEVVRTHLENGFRTIYDVYESLWIAMRSGTVDKAYAMKLFDRYLPYTSVGEIGRHVWHNIREGYAPEFVKFVDNFQKGMPPPKSDEEMITWINSIRKYRPEVFFVDSVKSP
jgi:hypothetical protein